MMYNATYNKLIHICSLLVFTCHLPVIDHVIAHGACMVNIPHHHNSAKLYCNKENQKGTVVRGSSGRKFKGSGMLKGSEGGELTRLRGEDVLRCLKPRARLQTQRGVQEWR